ncbi:MAG: acetoin utilization protein AcuC [Candidatus Lokiarchaeota archaeon]|nr:acetoin utilization protein AcuC [Candidatus Lokiarchaeota archaeon]
MKSEKVGLVFTEDYQKYNFGDTHPLRPLRLSLTYSLMKKIGLFKNEKLEILDPKDCTDNELELVHTPDYIDAVKKLSINPQDSSVKPSDYGLGPGDNPIFKGMFEASALVCGASITAAKKVWDDNSCNVAFNPAGGLHHAIENRASGFCIFNDIAVALRYLKTLDKDIRIAYLDIDCHHGDGVQWIFYEDPNVLTISLHESGQFLFPGTGHLDEIGEEDGTGFSINFPLVPGTNNKLYLKLFKECIPKILENYQPDILATQLGVDIHYSDPLTQMGTSLELTKNLAQEMDIYAQKYCNNKWLAFGGGGYSMTVVPRAWTLFLAQMLDEKLPNELPISWINEIKKKVKNEKIPKELWDSDTQMNNQLFKNSNDAENMENYIDTLIELCHEKFLPNLTKK